MLAEAIIGEAKERKDKDIKFVCVDGQSFEHKHVGVTEERWRNVFAEAVKNQLCILFIDEIDGVLSERGDFMYERLGIYEQMDNGTFVDKPLDNLELISDDFEKVIK